MHTLSSLALLLLGSGSPLAGDGSQQAPPTCPPQSATPASAWDYLRTRYDADGDGRITRAEYSRQDAAFAHLDADRNGVITLEDFDKRWDGVPRVQGKGRNFVYGQGGPMPGEPAPDIHLTTTGGEELELAQFRGKKPVALVFGSFT